MLRPGGRLLLSVPAYQWAWSAHDVRAGHHRRYTRPRLRTAVERPASSYVGAPTASPGVFPIFAAERLARRLRDRARREPTGCPRCPPTADRVLLGLSRAEARVLRGRDLPFGSSVFLAADKR